MAANIGNGGGSKLNITTQNDPDDDDGAEEELLESARMDERRIDVELHDYNWSGAICFR